MFLMSIKPVFARELFLGYKRFELRRVLNPHPKSGDLVVVYVSGNVQALTGEFRVGRVFRGKPEKLFSTLEKYKPHGLRSEHWSYIRSLKEALAIEVVDALEYPLRVKLSDIRRIIPGFKPPYTYTPIYKWDPIYQLILLKVWKSFKA